MGTTRRSWTLVSLTLVGALMTSGVAPVVAQDSDLIDLFPQTHHAPALEATLITAVPSEGHITNSFVGDAAAEEWDEGYLLHHILASTCREVDHFQTASLYGDRSLRALRFVGAGTARLREGYLQAWRFVGPQTEPAGGPYGWFATTTGWWPTEESLGERSATLYHGEYGNFYTYFSGDTVYEVDAYRATPTTSSACCPTPRRPVPTPAA